MKRNLDESIGISNMWEQLVAAIKENNAAKAQGLITEMTLEELSNIGKDGMTALTLAASNGLEKICEQLIPKMSQQAINTVNQNGYTALTLAANKGLEKICQQLIPKMSTESIN